MSYLQKIQDMYRMIGEGKTMEALEQYYHDDVVVIDGNSPLSNGKAEQRKAVEQWESMVTETHGGGVGFMTAHEDDAVTMVESWADVTF